MDDLWKWDSEMQVLLALVIWLQKPLHIKKSIQLTYQWIHQSFIMLRFLKLIL